MIKLLPLHIFIDSTADMGNVQPARHTKYLNVACEHF
jgi:hypothetical protein